MDTKQCNKEFGAEEIKSLLTQHITKEAGLRRRVMIRGSILSLVIYVLVLLASMFIFSPSWGGISAVMGGLFLALFISTGFKWKGEAGEDATKKIILKYPKYAEILKKLKKE